MLKTYNMPIHPLLDVKTQLIPDSVIADEILPPKFKRPHGKPKGKPRKKQQENYRGLKGKINVARVEWHVTIGVHVGISHNMFKVELFFPN